MSVMDRKQVEKYKEQYPPGTRVELIEMNDPYKPVEAGMRGTVAAVDDAGQIHMKWDDGRTLAIVPEVDTFRKLSKVELDIEAAVQACKDMETAMTSEEPKTCSSPTR